MQSTPRSLLSLSMLAALAAFGTAACATEVAPLDEGEGDTGEVEAAVSTTACKLSRASILEQTTGSRRTAVARGFTWYDARVPYSQSRSRKDQNGTYRTDCSGFVSMCWQLGTSYTTADFVVGGGKSGLIGAYSNLLPGDALVRRANGAGHMVLFLGWNDAAHTAACVLEQASTAQDMQFRTRSRESLTASGYKAIRADDLESSGEATGADEDEPDPESDNGGQPCTSTGACNPGNDGKGLICVGGFCKPGCLSNAQCPGATTCNDGQCR